MKCSIQAKVTGLGFLLGDKKAGPFKLEVEWIKVGKVLGEMFKVLCEGTYQHHLQGVCTDENSIYWSFTTNLVKTDMTRQFAEEGSGRQPPRRSLLPRRQALRRREPRQVQRSEGQC